MFLHEKAPKGAFSYIMLNPFYTTTKWKKKRASVLKRDGYLCQDCLRYGRRTEATEVHHIDFLENAPEKALDSDNLISLCRTCHNKRHPEKAIKSNARRKPTYY